MNWVMLATGEMSSSRFDRLLEALEVETRDDRYRVFGHLSAWFSRWAQDPEYDHGLFFDANEKRMGIWADWGEPLAFGRALHRAGYVSALADVYPAELIEKRTGLVARSPGGGVMLDVSWQSVHRRRGGQAHELFVFLTDRRMRIGWAREYGISYKGPVPDGWLDGPAGSSPAGEAPEAVASGVGHCGVGSGPGSGPGSQHGSGGGSPGGCPPPPRADVGSDVKRSEDNQSTSTSPNVGHLNQGTGWNGGTRAPTGRPKTEAMRDFFRANKYENPFACLRMADETERAMSIWTDAVNLDPHAVGEVLANMVETDDAWLRIGSPAGVLVSKLLPMVQKARRERRNGRSR